MPDRFWVGGTASWDATAGTKWAATSGGAGGQAVPTSADDVYFDAASGAVTVTVTVGANCLSLNFTGFTGTIAGTSNINVFGNFTLSSGMTWSHTGGLLFDSTTTGRTITTAGRTISSTVLFGQNQAGGGWTLQDAFTTSSSITVTRGTFTTNNFNVTATTLSSNNSNTRAINLGSSTVTLTASLTTVLNFQTNTNLTFNAGTSTVVFSGTTTVLSAGGTGATGNTFNNVSYTATSATTHQIQGINTFNNLTVTAPAAAGVTQVTFDSRQTINGTLSTTGTAGNRRAWFRGLTYGIAQTLTINSAPSLTDADFRDIYVIGTAAPISGTRIGDLGGDRGITASTPKTVYWNLAAGGNWSANAWAATSGGGVSTDNFPLAQDTAVIENTGLNTSATVTFDGAVDFIGTLNMSTRSNAMTFSTTPYGPSVYGNLTLGSGVTTSGANGMPFRGRNTQTITSNGRTLTVGNISIDTYGGSVELADALNIGTNSLTVTNGTFDTKNFNVTAGSLLSSNTNVRTITLGSSTVTLSNDPPLAFSSINITFNAGTSNIICSSASISFTGAFQTFYDVSFTGGAGVKQLNSVATYRNLSVTAPASAAITTLVALADQTITGTLTVAGATAVRRIFLRSNTLGTPRTLTVNSLSATDCDFRDITIAGAAAGSSPTRAGNCGGNTGITFPAAKTVYWNLAGTNSWTATAWASSSGGTPDINNFPLAQDTAVINDAGAVTRINASTVNVGTIDFSARTTAVAFALDSTFTIYGNTTLSSAVTLSGGNGQIFAGRGTTTITSAGKAFLGSITVECVTGTVQLADAFTSFSLNFNSGTFDAVTYNVTLTSNFSGAGAVAPAILRMGSGTWTLSGTGTVWNLSSVTVLYKGTANILLSNTSTTARTFEGGGLSYNKLTIGGATGTSTLTITGDNQFTEFASTKTVAHTIALGTATQTFGAWTVTGTAGNVVTLTGSGTSHILAGACTSGIDYLAMGSIGFSDNSCGEFYAGANSTGTAAAPVYRTAKPADSTRFWVGGTGNWSDTARWSTSSGGASGASVPRSHDDVVFNSASNATAYTATVNAVTGGIRTKALTIAGPASGNLTLAGSALMTGIHGSVTLPATGLTRTYTGLLRLSGSTTGNILLTNGVELQNNISIDGVGCEWTLGSALSNLNGNLSMANGSFVTNNYNVTVGQFSTASGAANNARSVTLGSSVFTCDSLFGLTVSVATGESYRSSLTFSAGTSQINMLTGSPDFSGNNQTFYNVSFTSTSTGTVSLTGVNTFNNLSFTGITSAGLKNVNVFGNQTISGTLTLSAGTNSTCRTFVRSDTIGTTRTLTCAAFSGTDADVRDITIAGAAAPVSGTRLGNCRGNSGITFPAAKTVYWVQPVSSNWNNVAAWAATSGGASSTVNFPLAQDVAVIESGFPNSGTTITVNAAYNIGTIDMSARTSNTMTLATGSTTPFIYGNWINGTGTTISGTGLLTFAGRTSQTITSAGKAFTQPITITTPGGSVALQDAFNSTQGGNQTIFLGSGTFNANNYNVTSNGGFSAAGALVRTVAFGSGTWTTSLSGGSAFNFGTSTNLTVTGTGTISLTNASAKTFAGGGISYSGITLNQGGAGTLTITGDNTFANISNTFKATGATTIALGTTTQRVGNFTASGEAGRVLTVTGSSASSPATLILTSGTVTAPDYLTVTGVRAYNLTDTWYAGANSTNNGSLGWIFPAGVVSTATGLFFLLF